MAVGDPIQGLRVAFKFADAQDTVEILKNLNLNIRDLDRIRGITDSGLSRSDIRTLSGLSIDLEKEAIAVYNETRSYPNILTNLNDGRKSIPGNLTVGSSLISPSFKFNTINYAVNNRIETVDFSTSRSSAWSSFGSSQASIFYGGDVIISGSTSTIELSSLEFIEAPKLKRFESQIATHKIRVTIDNEQYDMYAMKGIPVQFKAFFRSAVNLRIDFDIINNIKPSWIIRNNNGQEFVYTNRSSTAITTTRQSIISFADGQSLERTIEFYYPVDKIKLIHLNAIRLTQMPNVTMANLLDLRVADNDLTEMPNFATLYPSITYIDISRNNLTRSNTPELRTFSPQVIQRLKTPNNTLKDLIMDGVYSNLASILVTSAVSNNATPSVITVTTTSDHGLLVGTNININFTTGTNATLASGIFTVASVPSTTTFTYTASAGGAVTTPGGVISLHAIADLGQLVGLSSFQATGSNGRRMSGTSPAVGNGILSYNIFQNLFTTLHPSVLQSTTLKVLNIRSNGILAALDTSGTNLQAITTFVSGGNGHPIVNLSGKPDLEFYTSDNQTFSVDNIGTTIFNNCFSLKYIAIFSSNVTGRLPNFTSNRSLQTFYSWGTSWTDASANYSIDVDTFGPTASQVRSTLSNFNLQSANLVGPIHPDAFANMTALARLTVRSYGRGITGVYPPSINQCFRLVELNLDQNFIGGEVPNFAGNIVISTISLAQNSFTGQVPVLNLSRLSLLFLNNNSLTKFAGLTCPSLTQLNASFNLLTEIPILSSLSRLQILLLNNNPGMSYIPAELSFVRSLRRVEMANCGFNVGTVDQILIDLNENYNKAPRRGVFVNLIGNSPPSATTEITSIISRLRREGWTLGLQA